METESSGAEHHSHQRQWESPGLWEVQTEETDPEDEMYDAREKCAS